MTLRGRNDSRCPSVTSLNGGAAYHHGFPSGNVPEVLDSPRSGGTRLELAGRVGAERQADDARRWRRRGWARGRVRPARGRVCPVPRRQLSAPAVDPRRRRTLARSRGLPVLPVRARGRPRRAAPQARRRQPVRGDRRSAPAVRAPAGARLPARRARRLPALPQGHRGARGPEGRRPVGSPCRRRRVAAILVLVLSAGISFGFVVQRGGIDLPVIAARAGARPRSPSRRRQPSSRPSSRASSPRPTRPWSRRAPRPRAHRPRRRHRRSPRRRRRPRPSPSPSAPPSSSPPPTTAPAVTPTPDGDAPADAEADQEAEERPLQAPRPVPQPAELLDLHGPVGRQPVQHRPLLRDPVERDLRLEPAVRERRPPARRRPDPDATAQALTGPRERPVAGMLVGARSRPARPSRPHRSARVPARRHPAPAHGRHCEAHTDALFIVAPLTRPKTRDSRPSCANRGVGVAGSRRCASCATQRGAGPERACRAHRARPSAGRDADAAPRAPTERPCAPPRDATAVCDFPIDGPPERAMMPGSGAKWWKVGNQPPRGQGPAGGEPSPG